MVRSSLVRLRSSLEAIARRLPSGRPEPTPRPIPRIGGFGGPHVELHDHALRLRRELTSAEERLREELAAADTPMPTPASIWDVKLYSTAVTVFCAMAVEAAINSYGLMRFSEETFESYFRYMNPTERRLRRLLERGCGAKLTKSDPLLVATKQLFARRNAIVHPQGSEATVDKEGFFRLPESAWATPTKSKHADASIAEMETFFAVFPRLDRGLTPFLRPWPLRSS